MFKRTRDYAKDYERVGKSVRYTGKYYRFDMPKTEQNGRKAAYVLLLFGAVALYILAGLSGSAAFGGAGKPAAPYVVLPYVGLLLPLGLGLGRAGLLAMKKGPLEYAEYDRYLVQQKGVLIAALALGGCVFFGQTVYVLFGGGSLPREIAAAAGFLLCEVCIYAAFRQKHALFTRIAIDEYRSVRYDDK
jgi:hypothetical protein